MPAITPQFMFDLESNMRLITSTEYNRLNSNLWWTKIAKTMPSSAKKERINWLLDSARIQRTGKGGNVEFEDIVSQTMEVENLNAAAGLELKKEQLDDLDGGGVQLAGHWSRQMGAYSSYWPQKMVAQSLLSNPKTYDNQPFFSLAHPVNPYDPAAGSFANTFTGAAAGVYPGALPIHATGAGSVTVDVAIQNLARAIAYCSALRMPNGEDPRFLRLAALMVPPALTARAQQITNAKFIAQAGGGGAGSADVEAVIRNFGLGQPIECPELAAAFPGGSDTTYYLAMEEITSNELGAWCYINREPFAITYHGPQTDAQLARIRKFQWTTEGRNVVTPGHPYLLFRGQAT